MLYPWTSQCWVKEDKDKKGKGKDKNNVKTEYFAGYCLQCKGWGHMKKPAESTKTEPPITGMLIQSDEASEIPADLTQWMYSVTKQESVPIANDFLIDSGAATLVCQQSLADILGGKPRGPGVELRSDTGHQFTTTGSTTIGLRTRDGVNPRTLDCKGRLSRWDKCVTEAISSSAAVLVERSSTSSLAIESSSSVRVVCIG